MDEERKTEFELIMELYPEELKAYLESHNYGYYKECFELLRKFHNLIVESAKATTGCKYFIDTGSWLDIMEYMLEHPKCWLKKYKKVLKILNKS